MHLLCIAVIIKVRVKSVLTLINYWACLNFSKPPYNSSFVLIIEISFRRERGSGGSRIVIRLWGLLLWLSPQTMATWVIRPSQASRGGIVRWERTEEGNTLKFYSFWVLEVFPSITFLQQLVLLNTLRKLHVFKNLWFLPFLVLLRT